MPRYMVQRTFPNGLEIPVANGGADICQTVVERNAEEAVTWVKSYVSADKRTTFCVYDAPTPEAIGKTAARNELPVDQITECGGSARTSTRNSITRPRRTSSSSSPKRGGLPTKCSADRVRLRPGSLGAALEDLSRLSGEPFTTTRRTHV